jgi:hypothetical protein
MDVSSQSPEPSSDRPDLVDVQLSRAHAPETAGPGRSDPPASLGLTVAAIVLAVVGLIATVMSAMLTDPNQSFGTFSAGMPWVAIGSTLLAIILGIVMIERRTRRRALLASVVGLSGIGFVVAATTLVPLPDLAEHVYGYACPYVARDLTGEAGTWLGKPLAYGSSITESDAMQGQAWTTFSVEEPINITEVARDAGVRSPRSGAYFAVPVTRGPVDDSGMMCKDPVKTSPGWFDASGTARAGIPLALDGYPGGAQGGRDNGDGTVTYYVIFDITPDMSASGAFGLSQMTSDESEPSVVFWGGDRSGILVSDPTVADPFAPFSPMPAETATADGTQSTDTADGTSADAADGTSSTSTDGTSITATDLYVADASATGSSPDVPLAFGDGLTMQSVRTGKDALKFVVSAPIDITAVARAAGAPEPTAGAYIAVPITSTEIDVEALTDAKGIQYPAGYWTTPDDDTDQSEIVVPSYPLLQNVDAANPDGTWSYYEIFDVPVSAMTDGEWELPIAGRDGAGQYWYWGQPQ